MKPSPQWLVNEDSEILRKKSKKILFPLSKDVNETIEKLDLYMAHSSDTQKAIASEIRPAIGIAAPQIGFNFRIFCIWILDFKLMAINPEIVKHSDKISFLESGEGCLSVNRPVDGYVPRYSDLILNCYDWYTKKNVTIKADGLLSICIQHEFDHLEGKLFIDHINKESPFFKKDDWSVLADSSKSDEFNEDKNDVCDDCEDKETILF